jgi:hypothetical protein
MNIKIEKEKKVYVAPSMDIVNMDHELILCCSGGIGCDDVEGDGEEVEGLTSKRSIFEFN